MEELSHYKFTVSLIILFVLLGWETLHPFFLQFRIQKERGLHGAKNIALQLINASIVMTLFITLWTVAARESEKLGFGILHQLSLSSGLGLIIAILLLDFWTYCWHRMSHAIPFLWRFHLVHHSDNKMDVTSANRFHLGEIIISSLLRTLVIFVVGAEITDVVIYEAIMFPIVQFHHANIVLPRWLDSFLRIFIPTPAMHKIHHSRLVEETNSNYSSLLSVWDRIFRSYRLKDNLEEIKFGLSGYDTETKQSFFGLLNQPFNKPD